MSSCHFEIIVRLVSYLAKNLHNAALPKLALLLAVNLGTAMTLTQNVFCSNHLSENFCF